MSEENPSGATTRPAAGTSAAGALRAAGGRGSGETGRPAPPSSRSDPPDAGTPGAGSLGTTIAMLCRSLSRNNGGIPAAMLPIAARLAGRSVRVLTLEPPETPPPVPVLVPRRIGPLSLDAGRLLDESGAGLVHTHGLWSTFSVVALGWRRRTGGRTIVSPHGMLDAWALAQGRGRKRAMFRAVERAHLDGSACIHALTEAEAASIRAMGLRAPIAIVPNGTDPVDPARVASLARPAFMDRPCLLFLGRLHAKKGVGELIAAWAKASAALPGWRLVIAGMDDGPNDFRARAAASGADIVFPGPLFGDDKAAAYAHAAAFVLPSHSEGLPLTPLEAWAHGRPVLMSAACNLPEGFAAGAAARIDCEPAAMAAAIVARLSDADWLAEAGGRGRALAARRHGWEGIAAAWRGIYDWALGLGPLPGEVVAD